MHCDLFTLINQTDLFHIEYKSLACSVNVL